MQADKQHLQHLICLIMGLQSGHCSSYESSLRTYKYVRLYEVLMFSLFEVHTSSDEAKWMGLMGKRLHVISDKQGSCSSWQSSLQK